MPYGKGSMIIAWVLFFYFGQNKKKKIETNFVKARLISNRIIPLFLPTKCQNYEKCMPIDNPQLGFIR